MKQLKMISLIVVYLLIFSLIALMMMNTGCASKPMLVKNCKKTTASDIYICEKY